MRRVLFRQFEQKLRKSIEDGTATSSPPLGMKILEESSGDVAEAEHVQSAGHPREYRLEGG